MNTVRPREVLAVLRQIETGEVQILNPLWDLPQDCWQPFTLSNGWEIVVFNDANEWDYLESATAPDGRKWEAATHASAADWPEDLQNFCPSNDSLIHHYGWLPESPWEVMLDGDGRRMRKPQYRWLDQLKAKS